MRLAAFTDYALRLLMHVAAHPDRLCTIAEVAERYGLSEAHLMKITHLLAQRGYVETVRGKGGGMRLARPAAQISIGDVVRCTETDFALVECFTTGHSCILAGGCGVARVLDRGMAAMLAELDAHTLADVLPAASANTVAPELERTIAAPRTRRRTPAAARTRP